MIGAVWSLITGNRLVRGLTMAVGAVLAFLGALAAAKRKGRSEAIAEAERDALEAETRGHKAALDTKDRIDAGETPADIIRRNDGRWDQ